MVYIKENMNNFIYLIKIIIVTDNEDLIDFVSVYFVR